MAPGSIASSDTSSTSSASSASLTSTLGSSSSSGSEKPGLDQGRVRAPRRHPPVLRMVLEALQAGEQRRGTSVAAIKVYILQKYPTVDVLRLKHLLKQALATGMHRGLLARPVNSKAKGATGSFKLVPKDKRKIQPKKTSTMTAPRRSGQAEGKDPKKPSESKKNPPNPGEVKKGSRKPGGGRTASSKPGAAKKAPKKGEQTEVQEARPGEARKSSQQPDKATQFPPSARGPSGKSKVKGGRNSQADTKARRKTKPGSQSSKPAVTKAASGAASPAKKKAGKKVPREAAARRPGEGPEAKAPVPPKGGGSKMEPIPVARKAEAPKGPRKPGIPTKSSSSKAASKKAEAES
ncbi:histone H1.8 [Hippopotamus amphibius kiboko]|uniref:histone H1.8 n=1 Tax=Hippopotamus amphibius kiboko TaxID=575201 RepID=UPI0025993053|nr:histone H1.8 [Hippopotamus amphibius kiboko]